MSLLLAVSMSLAHHRYPAKYPISLRSAPSLRSEPVLLRAGSGQCSSPQFVLPRDVKRHKTIVTVDLRVCRCSTSLNWYQAAMLPSFLQRSDAHAQPCVAALLRPFAPHQA